MSNDVNDGSADTRHNLENFCNPYGLFRKGSYHSEVYAADDRSSREHQSAITSGTSHYNEERTYESMIVLVGRPTVLAPP